MIDWEAQWAAFAPDFREGLAHINLGDKTLLLKPGAGFGDFSHPTTRLVLDLMQHHVRGKNVLDIGCGSGILSVAAALMGAAKVFGIDIDEAAIAHSRENAKLNGVEARFGKKIGRVPGDCVVLMNMIFSEQREAWGAQAVLDGMVTMVITSGILATQREDYLRWAGEQGWVLQEEKEEEGWSGFLFALR